MTLTPIDGGGRVDLNRVFEEALRHPSPGFALGRRLAELYPELALVELDSHLALDDYARAGHAVVEHRPDVYHQIDTAWFPSAGDQGIDRMDRTAWLTATWQGTKYSVVHLTSPGKYTDDHRTYVLGPNRDRCDAFVAAVSAWNHEVRGEILVFSDGCFAKSAKLFEAVAAADFDHVILAGTLKQQIRDDFTQFLGSRATYEEHGVPWRRGALFTGPPGNGKTLCVKALVRALAIPCLYVQSFEAQYATPQHGIEAVFRRARDTAPCLIVLEDLDALLTETSRSLFLNELDGFAANPGVITVATTNHPERLDPSIVERPSRFDRKYNFDLPDAATRAAYIAAWNARLKPALAVAEAGRAQLADLTAGFSFAYIQEVFVASTMQWMATRASVGILPIALDQIALLRAQMQSKPGSAPG